MKNVQIMLHHCISTVQTLSTSKLDIKRLLESKWQEDNQLETSKGTSLDGIVCHRCISNRKRIGKLVTEHILEN